MTVAFTSISQCLHRSYLTQDGNMALTPAAALSANHSCPCVPNGALSPTESAL